LNAVEIEQAISALAEQPFDAQEFPFAFLQAFGNKETTIRRLRAGASNKSDLGGVLQTNNIHIAVCQPGEVTKTLGALEASPATAKAKARFILATDGANFEAEDLETGETVACAYQDFPDHFGFFLPLAGITTVKQVRESSFDIRATSRLNRLYVELLKNNPEWGTAQRRHDLANTAIVASRVGLVAVRRSSYVAVVALRPHPMAVLRRDRHLEMPPSLHCPREREADARTYRAQFPSGP
jgi:hypothetical protein